MGNTYEMIDKLEKEMDMLRAKYPELFMSRRRVMTIQKNKLKAEELIEAFRNLGEAFTGLSAGTISVRDALAREQARRKQASWLWRAKSWLRAMLARSGQ